MGERQQKRGLSIAGAGPALAALRKKAGLSSCKKAAAEFGWDASLIGRYEGNKVAVPEEYLEKLAGLLKMPTSAVVLECLKSKYPDLARAGVGRLLDSLISELQ